MRQRHRLAEHGYREALRRDPAHVQALMNLASLRLVLRCHVTEAEALYRRVVAAEPRNGNAWFNMGMILKRQEQRVAEAEPCFREALRAPPGNEADAETVLHLGDVLWSSRRDFAGAELLFRRVLEADPQHVNASIALGKMLQQRATETRAASTAGKGSAAGAAAAAAHNSASAAVDSKAAAGCFKRVLKAQPSNVTALFAMGTLALPMVDMCVSSAARTEAEQHFRSVLRVAPDHLGALRALAEVCLVASGVMGAGVSQREAPPATPERKSLVKQCSTNGQMRLDEWQCLAESEEVACVSRLAEAEALLRRSLRHDPRHPLTLMALATVLRPRRCARSGLGGRRPKRDVDAAEKLLRLCLRLSRLRLEFHPREDAEGSGGKAAEPAARGGLHAAIYTGQAAGEVDSKSSSDSSDSDSDRDSSSSSDYTCLCELHGTFLGQKHKTAAQDQCAEAMLRLAELLTEDQHAHGEAAELLRGLVTMRSEGPVYVEACYTLGELLARRARALGGAGAHTGAAYREAERQLRACLRNVPAHAFAADALAVVYAATGRHGEAETLLRTVVAHAPQSAHAKIALAAFLRDHRDDVSGACALYRAVLAHHPTHACAMGQLAWTLGRGQPNGALDVGRAEALFKQAVAFGLPDENASCPTRRVGEEAYWTRWDALGHLAPTYNLYGEFLCSARADGANALAMFEHAVRVDPADSLSANNLAALLQSERMLGAKQRDPARARALLEHVLAVDPADTNTRLNLGVLLAAAGEREAAERHLTLCQSQSDGPNELAQDALQRMANGQPVRVEEVRTVGMLLQQLVAWRPLPFAHTLPSLLLGAPLPPHPAMPSLVPTAHGALLPRRSGRRPRRTRRSPLLCMTTTPPSPKRAQARRAAARRKGPPKQRHTSTRWLCQRRTMTTSTNWIEPVMR